MNSPEERYVADHLAVLSFVLVFPRWPAGAADGLRPRARRGETVHAVLSAGSLPMEEARRSAGERRRMNE